MAYAFRASSVDGNSAPAGSNLVVDKPTGTADGDLLIVSLYLETDTNTWSTVPSGWTSAERIANTGAFSIETFWKIASGEPATWTWVAATAGQWRTSVCAAYTGALGTGTTRVDVKGSSQADAVIAASQTAPSVTTTVANDLVTFSYGNFGGTNVTATTGFCTNTRVSNGGDTISDANNTTASATGTSNPSAGPGTQDYAASHVAYFLDTGGGGGVVVKKLPALGVG